MKEFLDRLPDHSLFSHSFLVSIDLFFLLFKFKLLLINLLKIIRIFRHLQGPFHLHFKLQSFYFGLLLFEDDTIDLPLFFRDKIVTHVHPVVLVRDGSAGNSLLKSFYETIENKNNYKKTYFGST